MMKMTNKKYEVSIWVHAGGDDQNYTALYEGEDITKAQVINEVLDFLKKKKSKVLDDYEITEVV